MARPPVQSENAVIQDRDDAQRIMRRAAMNRSRDRKRNAIIVDAASRLYLLLAQETALLGLDVDIADQTRGQRLLDQARDGANGNGAKPKRTAAGR